MGALRMASWWPVPLDRVHAIPPGGAHRVHGRAATRAAKARRGRIGYAYVHSAVDDHSRLAYSEVLADETAPLQLRSGAGPRSGSGPGAWWWSGS